MLQRNSTGKRTKPTANTLSSHPCPPSPHAQHAHPLPPTLRASGWGSSGGAAATPPRLTTTSPSSGVTLTQEHWQA